MTDARIPVVIVELDLDTCGRVYNTAPCTAVVPDGRNNYIAYSQNFASGLWSLSGFQTLNDTTAPDGTLTASKLGVVTNTWGSNYFPFAAPFSAPARFFVWVKQGVGVPTVRIALYNITLGQYVSIGLWTWATSSGVGCSVVDTAAGGWVRLELRCNNLITAGNSLQFFFDSNGVVPVTDYAWAWGAQACFPAYTSDFRYIATAGATVVVNPAVVGTGTSECFNTFSTCQDKTNYLRQTKTYRFSNQRLEGLQLAGEAPTFPVVNAVELAPTELSPREGLGVRASCTVQMSDFVYSDEGVDPYRTTRRGINVAPGVDWEKKSTFARRFLARNANYENRVMRVKTGYRDEWGVLDLSSFTTRSYIIQSATWPGESGNWSITGKDPLRLADADRAVWPSRARIKITTAATVLDTLLLCDDPTGRLLTDFNATQRYIRIGQEFLLMTAVAVSNGVSAVTVVRASLPSFYPGAEFNIAAVIDVGAAVISCYYFNSRSLPQVMYTLLNSACGLSASYLPLTAWEASMTSAGRGALRLSALIPEPMSAKDLITEISQLNVNVWWSDRLSQVLLQAILVNPPLAATWSDRANIIDGSVEVALNSRSRVSQSWIYYGHQWPLAQMDKLESFYSVEGFSDLGAEAVEFFGTVALQETRSRWLPVSQGSDAVQMVSNSVLRYRYGKVGFTVSVDSKDSAAWTGDTVGVTSLQVVDPLGNPSQIVLSIMMAEEQYTESGRMFRYTGEGQATGILSSQIREAPITLDTQADYSLSTADERTANCYICNNSGQFSDGKPSYTLAG